MAITTVGQTGMVKNLIADFLTGLEQSAPETDDTANAILDATLVEVGRRGLPKASLEAIAKRAGVNRVTIYRRFVDRDGLMAAWAYREGTRMAHHLAAALAPYDAPADRLREGLVSAAAYARNHPFAQNLARQEPAAFVDAFRADDAALLQLAGAVVAVEIRSYQERGYATHIDADQAGEAVARLLVACVLIPGGTLDIDDPQSIRAFGEQTLLPMVLGPAD